MNHGVRLLTDAELHAMRNKALYRGMDATARMLKREQLRRLEWYPVLAIAS